MPFPAVPDEPHYRRQIPGVLDGIDHKTSYVRSKRLHRPYDVLGCARLIGTTERIAGMSGRSPRSRIHLSGVQGNMQPMTGPRMAMPLAVVVVCAAVAAMLLIWLGPTSEPRSEVVGDSPSREGWKTIAYQGVQVDIPSAWEWVDMDSCEFHFERWARPDSAGCDFEGGAGFYGSSTFDPASGPGVRRTTENGIRTWGGYAYAGDFAVYASDDNRDVVKGVLDSVRVTNE